LIEERLERSGVIHRREREGEVLIRKGVRERREKGRILISRGWGKVGAQRKGEN